MYWSHGTQFRPRSPLAPPLLPRPLAIEEVLVAGVFFAVSLVSPSTDVKLSSSRYQPTAIHRTQEDQYQRTTDTQTGIEEHSSTVAIHTRKPLTQHAM